MSLSLKDLLVKSLITNELRDAFAPPPHGAKGRRAGVVKLEFSNRAPEQAAERVGERARSLRRALKRDALSTTYGRTESRALPESARTKIVRRSEMGQAPISANLRMSGERLILPASFWWVTSEWPTIQESIGSVHQCLYS
jgi:hypothetical protein